MFVGHESAVPGAPVAAPGAEKVWKQSLVGPGQGWQGWVMRRFTLEPGGHTPRHRHPWPHINYILQGRGVLFVEGEEYTVAPGSVGYVPPNAEHQFTNTGPESFVFICIVPEHGDV
ncbi:MAG: cupin domain-containing protein [Desulfotomaculales bacterium]